MWAHEAVRVGSAGLGYRAAAAAIMTLSIDAVKCVRRVPKSLRGIYSIAAVE